MKNWKETVTSGCKPISLKAILVYNLMHLWNKNLSQCDNFQILLKIVHPSKILSCLIRSRQEACFNFCGKEVGNYDQKTMVAWGNGGKQSTRTPFTQYSHCCPQMCFTPGCSHEHSSCPSLLPPQTSSQYLSLT